MSLRETINGTTPGDRILLLLLLCASIAGIFFIKEVLPRSQWVIIEVEGKATYRYPLQSDRKVNVEGASGRLTVEIRNGKVRVVNPTCPNRLCERQGWIIRGVILCLPARIYIIVGEPGRPEDRKVDAVSG